MPGDRDWRQLAIRFGSLILGTGAVFALVIAALGIPLSLLSGASKGDPAVIEMKAMAQRSYVFAADNTPMAMLRDEINRQPVALKDVPSHVVDAIVAVEDKGFWTHDGVDVRGVLRAFSVNVGEGGIAQGGSTITQQLVKLTLLTSERTLDRKAQEIVLAQRLEEEMSKEDILIRYLNTVYFGNSAYGLQAAAETYFGVGVQDLDKTQAALLAGVIGNPSAYDPIRHPEAAKRRRALATQRMEDEGIISSDEAAMIKESPLPTEIHQTLPLPDDYFVEEVKNQLLRDERLGATKEDREKAVFAGGLKVYTTFDPRAQQAALAARDAELPAGPIFEIGTETDPNTGQPVTRYGTAAVASVEPASGAIRAMVGGPGFRDWKYNLTTHFPGRQTGSSFKTFVLATLMEQGYSPDDSVDGGGPCMFANPQGSPNPYVANNFGGSGGEIDTIVGQTARSSNCAYLRLGQIAGLNNVAEMAYRLGVVPERAKDTPTLPPTVMSMPLGTMEMTPIEMAGAYAAIANDGMYNKPYYIERVEDAQGRVIFEHQPAPAKAMSAEAARLTTSVLEHNIDSGTGTRAQLADGRPAAGKTGTTTDSADAWFVGYTPNLATAVWIGGMEGRLPITLNGEGITGSNFPARIWGNYMSAYHQGVDWLEFAGPPGRGEGGFIQAPPEVDLSGQQPEPEPPFPWPPGEEGDLPIPPLPGDRDDLRRPTTTTSTSTTRPGRGSTTTTTEGPPITISPPGAGRFD